MGWYVYGVAMGTKRTCLGEYFAITDVEIVLLNYAQIATGITDELSDRRCVATDVRAS